MARQSSTDQQRNSTIKWIILAAATVIILLLLLNWLLLRSLCSQNWISSMFGWPARCQTTDIRLPNANSKVQTISISGRIVTLSEDGGSFELPELRGENGRDGESGEDGIAGAKGATGDPASFSAAACGVGQASQWNGASFLCVSTGGGTLDDAYNFGGPAAGRSINVLAANSPVQVNTTVPISGGPVDFNLGLTVTGDGGLNNPAASGVGFAKLVGDFGGGISDGSATIYSGNINNFSSGAFGFNAFLDYPGNELYVNGLNNGFGLSYGQMVFGTFGASLGTGSSFTPVGNGLGLNLSTGDGGLTSGNGGDLNFGTGSAVVDGNGGNISFGTGQGIGPTGSGGNFNVFTNNGDMNGGGISLNTGSGVNGDGGGINLGAGFGNNNGGYVNINAGNSNNNQGGNINFSAGGSTNGNGGDVNASTGFSSTANGGNFNFNAQGGDNNGGNFNASGGFATNGSGGFITLNAGGSTNGFGGGLIFNGGGGNSGGGSLNINAGNDTSGFNGGGTINMNSGQGLNGGDFNISSGNGNFTGLDNGGSLRLRGGDANQFGGSVFVNSGNSNTTNGGGVYTNTGNGVFGGDINFQTGSSNAGSNGGGGNFNFNAGSGDGAGGGGYFTVNAGSNAAGFAGGINLNAGQGGFGGGGISLQSGFASGGSNANGGGLSLYSGNGDGTGSGGDINIYSGSGAANGAVIFGTGGAERGRFDSAGNLGVGTPAPANKLDVVDTSDDSVASFTGTSGTCTIRTDLGTLDCPSDRTLKTNILSIGNGLDTILSLEGVTYNWKANEDGVTVPGFIAQDVEKVLPNLVTHHSDGTLSLSKEGILPYLVEAVKTQNGKIEDINKQLADQGIVVVSLSDELKALTKQVNDHEDRLKSLEETNKQLLKDVQELKAKQQPSVVQPVTP